MAAGADAQALQALGGAINQGAELAIGYFAAHEIDRRAIAPFGDGVVQNLLDRSRATGAVHETPAG